MINAMTVYKYVVTLPIGVCSGESRFSVTLWVSLYYVLVRLRMNLLGGCALACPFQIRGKYWFPRAVLDVRVFKEAGTASGW